MKTGLFCLKFLLILQILLWSTASKAQQGKVSVSGYLKDATSGEAMMGANIFVKELNIGTATNDYGFYSLTLTPGVYTLVIDYLGFQTLTKTIELKEGTKLDIELQPDTQILNEIVVSTEAEDKNIRSNEMSVTQVSIKELKKMPAMLGEVDVVRSIQLTPGVSTVGEGAAGFNVRGGGIDQNLILLDDAPVYNSSHLYGFFSVFNPDAVRDVKLMKGGIPAQYGGRLSSLLDVRMKEGNNRRFEGSGGIGTVSSRLTLEGPIKKEKGSFIVAGRRSYADLFLKLTPDFKDNVLYFYDLSAKGNYNITSNDKLFVSGYFGRDVFRFGKDFYTEWGNQTATVRWNHIYNSKLFSNVTAVMSNYDYNLGVPSGAVAFDWKSYIRTQSVKADFNYFVNTENTLSFGASGIYYRMEPGKSGPLGDKSIFKTLDIEDQKAREYAAYVSNEQKLNPRLSLEYGLRYSLFNYVGSKTVYDYATKEVGKQKEMSGQRTFKDGESVKLYHNLEPRFSARYILNEESSLKLGYNRMSQYIHLLSNTTASSPLDIWTPSTNNIKPELADQIALGYFKNLKGNTYELSAETYYKKMQNQVDYINGAQILLNEMYEGDLLYGQGRAYGLELMARKNKGKLTGWVSYTLSKSERKIEGINNNEYYRAKYDKPHNLSLVGMYELNDRWSVSANFNYSSGVVATFPNARYEFQGVIVPHNTDNERNNYRLPAYHRLDLSATYKKKYKKERRFQSEWVFSLYNAYGRRNPFTIYFQQNKDNRQQTEAIRLSILGVPLPSVTYNFKF
ncbi:MAG TPA: TonB-dependent receptor [Cytophagaceae bacterium]